jgi:hypothetical protein
VDGVLRGLLRSGLTVTSGFKVGDIDPRARIDFCFSVSDKARAIAGGVLEAIISLSGGLWVEHGFSTAAEDASSILAGGRSAQTAFIIPTSELSLS